MKTQQHGANAIVIFQVRSLPRRNENAREYLFPDIFSGESEAYLEGMKTRL